LVGIRATARANIVLLTTMFIVIAIFIFCAGSYVIDTDGVDGLLSTRPFYDPETFNVNALATATAFAALTYIGFDGVTTLGEDVKNPKRNVMLATLFIC